MEKKHKYVAVQNIGKAIDFIPNITLVETKVLNSVLDMTISWGETKVNLSFSQLKDGDMKHRHLGLPFTDPALRKAVQSLQKKKLLFVSREGPIRTFSLNISGLLRTAHKVIHARAADSLWDEALSDTLDYFLKWGEDNCNEDSHDETSTGDERTSGVGGENSTENSSGRNRGVLDDPEEIKRRYGGGSC
jgi:hypothetical protein